MVERDEWEPCNKEATFNAVEQGENTQGGKNPIHQATLHLVSQQEQSMLLDNDS